MKIQIPDKSNFIRTFLSPLSKIDNTPDIKVEEDQLTCFVDRGSFYLHVINVKLMIEISIILYYLMLIS